ncbi:MAG: DUF2793 domain-containing protein [Sphingomonas sp.]
MVVAVASPNSPLTPTPGQGLIIGPSRTGAWAGAGRALAVWTAGNFSSSLSTA